jgi:hypothetical protein
MIAGKLSSMDLRQQAEHDVKGMLAAHGSDLAAIRVQLDVAVQEVGGYWEDPNPDFASIDPSVRAGHVRQLAAGQVVRQRLSAPVLHTLRLKIASFAGLHLFTPEGERIRTRKRPVERRTGQPMHVTQAGSEPEPLFGEEDFEGVVPEDAKTLFGYDPSARPYEVSILMDIDLGTKTLTAASLAAIDWGNDDKGRKIYYEEEIPALPMQLKGPAGDSNPAGTPGSWGVPGSGFEDLLNDEGEETGSDPA